MRTSLFAFFLGLGTSFLAFVSIGLPILMALQGVALLAVFTLTMAGIAGLATGEFRKDADAAETSLA